MKNFFVLALVLSSQVALAAQTVVITGNCQDMINDALGESYDGEANDCVDGSGHIDGEALSMRRNKVEVSYSRDVCEGYLTGTAEVTLKNIVKKTVGNVVTISDCDVVNFEITEESGDK